VLIAEERGFANPALALSVSALAAIVGRLAGGMVADRLPVLGFAVAVGLNMTLAVGIMAFAGSMQVMLLAAVLLGLSIGNIALVGPLLIIALFGVGDFARISAVQQLWAFTGSGLGPILVGTIHDRTGAFTVPLLLLTVVCGTVTLLLLTQRGRIRRTA
jgi:CP family cyanate transporter-like MFS transporter